MTEYAAGQLYLDSGDVLWIAKTSGTSPTWAAVQGLCTVASTAGAPSSGYWSKGQQYLDSNDLLWECVVAGTPGTWQVINSSGRVLAYKTGTKGFTASPGTFATITATTLALSVVAPPTGKVKLTFSALLNNGVSGVHAEFIWNTSGGSIPGAMRSGEINTASHRTFVCIWSALTPGSTYTATLQWAYYSVTGAITIVGTPSYWIVMAEAI